MGTGISSVEPAPGGADEEHWVRGSADLYGYDDAGRAVVVKADLPYTTRLVVRRPANPTGDVVIEPLHPAGDMASAWPRVGAGLLREGWTWVGVTSDLSGLRALQQGQPDRYRHLDLPQRGIGFDILSQAAMWLRAEGLADLRPEHLFMTGASYTGSFQRVFLADGFHDRTRRADGSPAVEGYLIQISSGNFIGGYLPLNDHDPQPGHDDARRIVGPHDVPVIELLSEGEAETNGPSRRPDSDDPGDRFRLYEVPGACHMSPAERAGGMPLPATVEEPSDFPMYALAGGALANLRRWAVEGVAPPRAERIELHAERDAGPRGARDEAWPAVRDEHGNACGGVRSPHVDVPVARYFPHSTLVDAGQAGPFDIGDLMGAMERFDDAELRRLYGTPETYRRRYAEQLAGLVDGAWVVAGDAERVLHRIADVTF
jgi:hypothetical protein